MSNLILEQTRTETIMGTIVSKVPDLLEARGWTAMDLVRKANLGVYTAYRLAAGETDITLRVLKQLCEVFGVSSIDEVITFVRSEGDAQEKKQ